MIRSFVCSVASLAVAAGMFVGSAGAATKTFNNPMQGPNRLDWCYNWGVGCGQQAADAWCSAHGYQSATGFGEDFDIGASTPTRLISTGAVCDQGFCDGFTHITCFKPDPASVTFNKPMYNGNRLDWCVNWGVGCGQQAADSFCQWKGFAHALGFAEAVDIGAATPTRLIGTGAVCDQGFCDGFKFIKCGS